jgi:DNA-binding transcriptional MerR regulator
MVETKKIYYTISEVSKLVSVPAYLLRHWENEFPQLTPIRNAKGNRTYISKDIATILAIKDLIQEKGYTLEKAKELIASNAPGADEVKQTDAFLKEHHEPVKVFRESFENERRRKALLEMKALITDILERFK